MSYDYCDVCEGRCEFDPAPPYATASTAFPSTAGVDFVGTTSSILSQPPRPEAFWLVWRPKGGGNPSVRHPTELKARVEADRLSQSNPGVDFFVLKVVSKAHTPRPVTPPVDVTEFA